MTVTVTVTVRRYNDMPSRLKAVSSRFEFVIFALLPPLILPLILIRVLRCSLHHGRRRLCPATHLSLLPRSTRTMRATGRNSPALQTKLFKHIGLELGRSKATCQDQGWILFLRLGGSCRVAAPPSHRCLEQPRGATPRIPSSSGCLSFLRPQVPKSKPKPKPKLRGLLGLCHLAVFWPVRVLL